MCMVIAKTKDMDRKDWLMLRKSGIGGSDAGAVCGLNPYMSPFEVYVSKTCDGISEDKPNNDRIDTKRLKTEMPDVYERFLNPVKAGNSL